MILAGDAGATKTELALFKEENGKLEKQFSEKYFSKEFFSLEDIIFLFLNNIDDKIEAACVGVPGPVINGEVKSTNLLWELDEKVLSEKLNIKKFNLANDVVAMATAVPYLTYKDLITIYKVNKNEKGNKIILAPGTGLGQAALFYDKGEFKVISSEGGHSDFAPTDEIEIELLKYLQRKFGHVSYERVASGQGLVNVFNFLKYMNYDSVNEDFLKRLNEEDPAAVISDEALSKKSKICEKALDIFVSVLGSQAGNMVLNLNATGGVYIGGGIPMKIIDKLVDGIFVKSFLNKGRLRYLVEKTPVYVIKDTSIGLYGAAILANENLKNY